MDGSFARSGSDVYRVDDCDDYNDDDDDDDAIDGRDNDEEAYEVEDDGRFAFDDEGSAPADGGMNDLGRPPARKRLLPPPGVDFDGFDDGSGGDGGGGGGAAEPAPQAAEDRGRPPPVSTEWDSGEYLGRDGGSDGFEEEQSEAGEGAADGRPEEARDDAARTGAAASPPGDADEPSGAVGASGDAFATPAPSSSNASAAAPMMNFRNPKRLHAAHAGPYPTQSLRSRSSASGGGGGGSSAADATLERVVAESWPWPHRSDDVGARGHDHRGPRRPPSHHGGASARPTGDDASASLAEVTPAFLRRAQQDLGVAPPGGAGRTSVRSPNALPHRRAASIAASNAPSHAPSSRPASRAPPPSSASALLNASDPASSFLGADASALDGTFVSVRDLDDDDDVPSVDDARWNHDVSRIGEGEDDDRFPTEGTSLLGRRRGGAPSSGGSGPGGGAGGGMPWRGGFFGSRVDREDRRERRRMRAREGRGWVRALMTAWRDGPTDRVAKGRAWEADHPIGGDFASQRNAHTPAGGLPRQRYFSAFATGVLCLHLGLCALHDLFLRYLSYRNPTDDEDVAYVSWNGEGKYLPPYWISFDGRVLNPLVGPGARTLAAFGALVPGLVLKGQSWRVVTAAFQTSSLVELGLHVWSLKAAVGGSLVGLEWKRGTFVAAGVYSIASLVGSSWSIAAEPGRLVASSGTGVAGVLAASIVERACFPLSAKDDDDDETDAARNGSEAGAIASSSNEQFTYRPPGSRKRRRRGPLGAGSPSLLLLLEVLTSWWSAHASLLGTVAGAAIGAACALLLFAGAPPPGSFDPAAPQDLLFEDSSHPSFLPPPPPPPARDGWRDDDDSADTSVGGGPGGRHVFDTPLMRRSILADEEDEEEPLGTRATLRRRGAGGGAPYAATINEGSATSDKGARPFSATRAVARVVGALLAILLTLIPASLIATGRGLSYETTRASVLGCRPMRILYREDDANGGEAFECAGGCIPLSREATARRREGMRPGRCDALGYRCWRQSGTMMLRGYESPIGIYGVPSADGSCRDAAGEDDAGGGEVENNDDASAADAYYNGEVEGVQ